MQKNRMTVYEDDEQAALFNWALLMEQKYPDLWMMYHVPNGGKRDKLTATKLKAQGVKKGVPDVCLPIARGGYHGLYIELKVGKNKTSEHQKKWLAALNKHGYAVTVCYGWQAAAHKLEVYLNLGVEG